MPNLLQNGAVVDRQPEASLPADGLSGQAACSPTHFAPETKLATDEH
jgi:hypothetical protein